MHHAIRSIAALLASLVILAAPAAAAGKINQGDVKKIVVAAAAVTAADQMKPKAKPTAAPKPPQVEIPGAPKEKPPANQKEAKKTAQEKAAALKQAARDSFQQVEKMAAAGDVQAQYILGLAYYTGQQVKEDDALAVAWWRKAAYGHPEAAAYVGLAYAQGIGGTLQDPREAKRRYLRAVKKGSALAQVLLGIDAYDKNTAESKAAALKRFRAAAKQGQPLARAFLRLIERKGTDARLNLGGNLDWKKEARKTPLTALYTEAGANAFWGRVVDQDYSAAAQWWRLSASQGNAAAQALLGTAYYTGRGVEQDVKAAAALFKAAAAQNEPLAQYMLGKIYLAGDVVQKNNELALKLLRAAGGAGIADAARQADALARRM